VSYSAKSVMGTPLHQKQQ